MKDTRHMVLKRELCSSGASAGEAEVLAGLAQRLQALRIVPERRGARFRFGLLPALSMVAVALLIGMATVAFSQTSLPGSWLYPVKRVSENTAVAASPDYRATLMMRRADEVRQLVTNGASTSRVTATLSLYQTEAAAYKSVNYPAFAYCRSNLKQAEQRATPAEKTQIAVVLKNLGDID